MKPKVVGVSVNQPNHTARERRAEAGTQSSSSFLGANAATVVDAFPSTCIRGVFFVGEE